MDAHHRRLLAAAMLGGALAAAVILASSRGRIDDATFGDGVIYRDVAQHLAAAPGDVPPSAAHNGTSLRYGRVGLPALLWVSAAGRPGAMRYAQPAIMVASAAAIAAAGAALFPGGGIALSLAPFVGIGVLASFAGGFAEAPAIAFALWAVVAALDGRTAAAVALFAAAMLTKESSIVALAGTMAWLALRGRRRSAAWLACSVVPVAIWYAYVAVRYGHVPPLDPWLRETGGVGAPPLGLWRSIVESPGGSAALAAAHAAAAAATLVWARRSIFKAATVFGAVLLAGTGPFVWRFIGDGVRSAALIETTVALAAVATLLPQAVHPAAADRGRVELRRSASR